MGKGMVGTIFWTQKYERTNLWICGLLRLEIHHKKHCVPWHGIRNIFGTQIHSVIVFLFLYSPRCFHVFSVSVVPTLSHSQCTTHLFIAYSYIWCAQFVWFAI